MQNDDTYRHIDTYEAEREGLEVLPDNCLNVLNLMP
jgi:hypothetical protein